MSLCFVYYPHLYLQEAVDTVSFDPALSPNSRFDFQITSCTPNPSVSNTEENMQQQVEGVDSCAISSVERPFQFLSIFKWEYRKGWDILLNAYWDAFEASDNVILRLRTYLPPWQRGHTNITDAIRDFAWAMRGKSLSELAPVEWVSGSSPSKLSDSMTRMDVRDLLASADSFVLPTRGEGWGLPIAEAMAMALPVIVTNYSGPTGYATGSPSIAHSFLSLGFFMYCIAFLNFVLCAYLVLAVLFFLLILCMSHLFVIRNISSLMSCNIYN